MNFNKTIGRLDYADDEIKNASTVGTLYVYICSPTKVIKKSSKVLGALCNSCPRSEFQHCPSTLALPYAVAFGSLWLAELGEHIKKSHPLLRDGI